MTAGPDVEERIGPWRLGAQLGDRPTGTVYEATADHRDGTFTIEVLHSDVAGDHRTAGRFLRERRIVDAFRHPNIVNVVDLVIDDDRLGIVSDSILDRDLRAMIAAGPSDASVALRLAMQIAGGLGAIHRVGLVHGGLTPTSVALTDTGGATPTAGIADLAQARLMGDGVLGGSDRGDSAPYRAPEIARGEPIDPAADVYSLGVILLELLQGRPPSPDREPPELTDLPDDLGHLLGRMLDPEPDRRPAIDEVQHRLRAALNGLASTTTPMPLQLAPDKEAASGDPRRRRTRARPGGGPRRAGRPRTGTAPGHRRDQGSQRVLIAAALVVLAFAAGLAVLASRSSGRDAALQPSVDATGDDAPEPAAPDPVDDAATESTAPTEPIEDGPPPLSICCWVANVDQATGASAEVSVETSTCTAIRWTDPIGGTFDSAGFPDAGTDCATVHTRTFEGLQPGYTYRVGIEVVDETGATSIDRFSFATPEIAEVAGPTICCWVADPTGTEAKVSFAASTCTTARWTGTGGEIYDSPGYPDASVNCWERHGRTFTGLQAGTAYTVGVELTDLDGVSVDDTFTFTMPG